MFPVYDEYINVKPGSLQYHQVAVRTSQSSIYSDPDRGNRSRRFNTYTPNRNAYNQMYHRKWQPERQPNSWVERISVPRIVKRAWDSVGGLF